MKTKHERFLKQLLETPSPTGYEVPVADVVRERLSGTAARFASLLNIKPILFADNGEIKKFDTARSVEKALKKMCDICVEQARAVADGPLHAAIVHCNCPERAEAVKAYLIGLPDIADVVIAPSRGVSTIYAADGGIVLAI